jgi:hypothetical protein
MTEAIVNPDISAPTTLGDSTGGTSMKFRTKMYIAATIFGPMIVLGGAAIANAAMNGGAAGGCGGG